MDDPSTRTHKIVYLYKVMEGKNLEEKGFIILDLTK